MPFLKSLPDGRNHLTAVSYTHLDVYKRQLLGHGGAGKTTVAEAMALITGVTKRMGKVADGNTISDYDKEAVSYTHLDVYKRQQQLLHFRSGSEIP